MTRLLIGFVMIWLVLNRSAAILGSVRGEAGSIKLVVAREALFPGLALLWIALAATVPWLMFLLGPSSPQDAGMQPSGPPGWRSDGGA